MDPLRIRDDMLMLLHHIRREREDGFEREDHHEIGAREPYAGGACEPCVCGDFGEVGFDLFLPLSNQYTACVQRRREGNGKGRKREGNAQA